MREAARLQSFSDHYVFYPTNQLEPIAKMIGNAVPPRMASFYARSLLSAFQGSPPQSSTEHGCLK